MSNDDRLMPYKIKLIVPIRELDDQFMHIQDVIDSKRQYLLKKQKKLKLLSKQNSFLESVRTDYSKYHRYIAQQKRDQMKALQLLDEYIQDLTQSGKLTKHNIDDAKEEQSKILREVDAIKRSLDTLMSDFNSVVQK